MQAKSATYSPIGTWRRKRYPRSCRRRKRCQRKRSVSVEALRRTCARCCVNGFRIVRPLCSLPHKFAPSPKSGPLPSPPPLRKGGSKGDGATVHNSIPETSKGASSDAANKLLPPLRSGGGLGRGQVPGGITYPQPPAQTPPHDENRVSPQDVRAPNMTIDGPLPR